MMKKVCLEGRSSSAKEALEFTDGDTPDGNATVDLLDSEDTTNTVILAESAEGEEKKTPSVVIIDHP